MSDPSKEDWLAQEPPADFAEGVMDRIAQETGEAPVHRTPWRRTGALAASLAVAAAVALGIGWQVTRVPDHGESIAADRTQISLSGRAVAVLEAGAHVTWKGDEVEQTAGDVFYRVEPGGGFRVHTPAGDVTDLGTCFRVRLSGTEGNVNGRDVKAGALGAALTAAALVTVYEGKAALSHDRQSVTLTAGEEGRSDARGVRRGVSGASNADPTDAVSDDPLVAANANLADSVREYKNRLATIEAQKTDTEKKLAEAQLKLAVAANDGQAPIPRYKYDLSPDELKELAQKGEVRAHYPCNKSETWNVSPGLMKELGLPDEDRAYVHDAYAQSAAQIDAVLRPLCVQALQGNAVAAATLSISSCQAVVADSALASEDTNEELRKVAEIRAGLIPMPTDPKVLGKYGAMMYALSGASQGIEAALAKSIGPDDTKRIINNEASNLCGGSWSVGPRAAADGTPGTAAQTSQ